MAVPGFRSWLAGGVLAAAGASLCCLGPLVLLGLGIGGAWIGTLTAFDSLRPAFIGVALVFLGLAFRQVYLAPKKCLPDTACAEPRASRRQKVAFWVGAFFILSLLASPMLAGLVV